MLRNEIVGVRERFTDTFRVLPAGCCRARRRGPAERGIGAARQSDLRAYCRRLFGWGEAQARRVDEVMDSLLTAVAHGSAIALRGESDLVPIAHEFHRRLHGPERPFIVCDPRRQESARPVRSPPGRKTGMRALEAARGGSVCLRAHRLPADFEEFSASLQDFADSPQVFVCLAGNDPVRDLLCPPIEIPSLAARSSELDRLVDDVLAEATRRLGAGAMRLPPRARDALLAHVTSLAELEKVLLRLAALRSAPNLSQAAARLGISPASLCRWAYRRRMVAILRDVEYDGAEGAVASDRNSAEAVGDPMDVSAFRDS